MAFNPQDRRGGGKDLTRRGSGWSSTAPKPFELDESNELILNINTEYKDRYRERLSDAELAEARRREWQVLEEGAAEREGDWSYQVIRVNHRGEEAECVRIAEYAGKDADVETPADLAGLPVWEVGPRAFAHKRTLRSVTLPNSVRRLGMKAFFCDFNLKRVVLSDAIEELGDNVFEQCRELEEVHLPRNLKAMAPRLLWETTCLKSLEIPASVVAISDHCCRFDTVGELSVSPDNPLYSTDGTCLFNAEGTVLIRALFDMAEYRVPEGCIEIAPGAFKGCRTLRRISLPEGLLRIGSRAFYHTGLASLGLPAQSPSPQPTRRVPGMLPVGSPGEQEGFPRTLLEIGEEAFAQTRLSRAHLPASLGVIGAGAFEGTNIRFEDERSFSIDPDNPVLSTDHAALYSRAAGRKSLVGIMCDRRSYKVDPATEEICASAFTGARQLSTVELPEGLRIIGAHAFEGCTNLLKAELPSTLEEIGERAFYETGLKRINLGGAVAKIGPLALATAGADHNSGQGALLKITVHPENERYYMDGQVLCERRDGGDAAIACEANVDVLRIPQGVTTIEDLAFAKVNTRELFVHDRVKQVNVRAFQNVANLETVHVDFAREVDGATSAAIPFPKGREKARWYLCALRMDDDGLFFDYAAYDLQVGREKDPYDVALLVLARLDDPIKLGDTARLAITAALKRALGPLLKEVVARRDVEMFERLADHGFITESNIEAIIQRSSAWREAEATAYLLEMKRRRFAAEADDDFSF